MKFTQHPLSAAFPAMSDADYEALVADIRANGQRDAAVAIGNEILDGWHRVQACSDAGIEPVVIQFEGDDLREFVLSKNLHRRQLDASQRARAIVAVQNWRPEGRPKNSAPGAEFPKSAAELAKEAGVSPRTIEQAKTAERAGLGEAIRDGKVSAKRAAEIAKLPEPERKAAIDAPKQKVVPIKPDEPDPDDGAPSEEELEEAAIQIRLNQESYDRILASDDKAAALDFEVKRLNALLAVETGQKNRYMNEAAEWKRRAVRAEKQLKRSAA